MEQNNMKNKNEKLKTKRNYSNCVGNYNCGFINIGRCFNCNAYRR